MEENPYQPPVNGEAAEQPPTKRQTPRETIAIVVLALICLGCVAGVVRIVYVLMVGPLWL